MEGFAHVWSGFLDHWQGNEPAALDTWTRARELGERHGLPAVLLWILWSQGLALIGRGRYDEAHAVLVEHLELTKRLGDRVFRCRTLNTLGWLYMDLCNWQLAVDHNRQGAEESRRIGDPEIVRNAELNLGDCHLALGNLDEAERLLRDVELESARKGAWGEEWMKWRYLQHLSASLGELCLARGDAAAAREHGERCLAAAQASRSLRNVVKARRLLAGAAVAQGEPDTASAHAEKALEVARAVGNPAQLRETLARLGAIRKAQGRHAEAVSAYAEALETVERVAGGLADPEWRDVLLGSPQVAALRQARDAVAAA
jgi:tetratricopeptide (TPR) repeat protein